MYCVVSGVISISTRKWNEIVEFLSISSRNILMLEIIIFMSSWPPNIYDLIEAK